MHRSVCDAYQVPAYSGFAQHDGMNRQTVRYTTVVRTCIQAGNSARINSIRRARSYIISRGARVRIECMCHGP